MDVVYATDRYMSCTESLDIPITVHLVTTTYLPRTALTGTAGNSSYGLRRAYAYSILPLCIRAVLHPF